MKQKDENRIIIKNRAQYTLIIDWFKCNIDMLSDREFHAPVDSGVIIVPDYFTELEFDADEDTIRFTLYVSDKDHTFPTLHFTFDKHTQNICEQHLPESAPSQLVPDLMKLVEKHNPQLQSVLEYYAVMNFMAYFTEQVIKETQVVSREPDKHKKRRKSQKRLLPLIRKIYILPELIEETSEEAQTEATEESIPRKYAKPTHEVKVRGHYRHYKDGRIVWVRPSVRYKGTGDSQGNTYVF